MKIVTYVSGNAPPSIAAIALFMDNGSLLPVRITASSEEEVRAKAEEFWASEKARWLKKPKKLKPPQTDEPAEPVVQSESPTPPDAVPRYFYHPESESFFTSDEDQDDPLVIELDQAEWEVKRAEHGKPEIAEAVVAEIAAMDAAEEPKPAKKRAADLEDLF